MPPTSRVLPLLIMVLLVTASCASTDEDPVVVAYDAPDVSRGESGPVPSDRPGEPSLLDPNRVVARVNDQVITVRTLNARYGATIRTLGDKGEAQVRYMLDQITEDFIRTVLVLEAAKTLGVTVADQEFQRAVEWEEKALESRDTTLDEDLEARGLARWEWEANLKRDILTKKLEAMLTRGAGTFSPETRAIVDIWVRPIDVQNFYERNREEFRVPEAAEVDVIYLTCAQFQKNGVSPTQARDKAREAATETVRKARAGEDFLVLMSAWHEPMETVSRPFRRGEQKPAIDQFAWDEETEVGDISDPIEMSRGFLIVKLKSRQEEGFRDFETVRPSIEQFLQNSALRLAQHNVQLQLLDEAVITPRRFKVALQDKYRRSIRATLEVGSK